jgi:hypothetical protein
MLGAISGKTGGAEHQPDKPNPHDYHQRGEKPKKDRPDSVFWCRRKTEFVPNIKQFRAYDMRLRCRVDEHTCESQTH